MKIISLFLIFPFLLQGFTDEPEINFISNESLIARFGDKGIVSDAIKKSQESQLVKSLSSFVFVNYGFRRNIVKKVAIWSLISAVFAVWYLTFETSATSFRLNIATGQELRGLEKLLKILKSSNRRIYLTERFLTHGFIYYKIIESLLNLISHPKYSYIKSYNNILKYLQNGGTLELRDQPIVKKLVLLIWQSEDLITDEQKAHIIEKIQDIKKGLNTKGTPMRIVRFTNGEFYYAP